MRTRIKFCGFTDERDLHEAAALGVDAVGFVFYPKSPRVVDVDSATRLRRSLPSWVTAVGLFVDAEAAEVEQAVSRVGLDVIQFHGDESPELCRTAAGPSGRWWRAVRMRAASDLLESLVRYGEAEALLLDSFSSAYGGSGKGFDWSWVPSRRPLPIVLSGGLSPDNVADAIAAVKPTMVDVSSGIQSDDPRRKDPARMERFVAEVLRADSKA